MVLKEKISSGRQFCWWKWPIDVRGQRRMAKLDWADSKATVTQITTCYNQCIKMSISVAPWSRCATATEDHIGWHFCQLRTESWGSSNLEDDWEKEAWYDDIRMVGSDFGVNCMDPSCLVTKFLAAGDGVMVWGIFSLSPLLPIERCLNATAYLSIIADHLHLFRTTVFPSYDG